ncbi:MAG: hypothetical protein JOZ19_01595 [Rubrobacter sp.]|nr:hypothetical protein [Rubrobacter sp.]
MFTSRKPLPPEVVVQTAVGDVIDGSGQKGARYRALTELSRPKPYTFHVALAVYLPALLYVDVRTQTLTQQNVLGALTFAFLFLALRFSAPSERRQVWVLVLIATAVELFSSGVWGVYAYRFGNVPLYVPPGHGLIYLFALRSVRTPLMAEHAKTIRGVAIMLATLWTTGGFTVGPFLFGRLDASAVLLWPVFTLFIWKSSSAGVYASAFFVTSMLELVGTAFGNWSWAAVMPVLHLTAGNPPSVIAGGYCVLDFAASRAVRLFSMTGWRSASNQTKSHRQTHRGQLLAPGSGEV